MDFCIYCDEPIEFRYINGRNTPIHSCFSLSEGKSLCRPTRCPYCGDDVFFIRFNGGALWVDSLGRPWPKHGCFPEDRTTTRCRQFLSEIAADADVSMLALVTDVSRDVDSISTVFTLNYGNNKTIDARVSGLVNHTSWIRKVVVVRKDTNSLHLTKNLHCKIENEPFQEEASLPPQYEAPLINTKVKIRQGVCCVICDVLVEEKAIVSHFKNNHIWRPINPKVGVEVLKEVCSEPTGHGWIMCFQKCVFNLDGQDDPGYRFIWRRSDGVLQISRGKILIPSDATIERLLAKARAAKWYE